LRCLTAWCMKNFFFKPFLNWFGFTRRERRASFLLLILIFIVAGFRYIIPQRNIIIEEIPVKIMKTSVTGSDFSKSINNPQRELVELNTSDSASLEVLPGIGPVLSVRIIKFRKLLGGFASVDQLREVYGLSEEVFNIISSRVYVDTSAVKKININKAGYKDIRRLPYFDNYEVNVILKYRKLKGSISCIGEMVDNKLITPEKAKKVRPYLEFGE